MARNPAERLGKDHLRSRTRIGVPILGNTVGNLVADGIAGDGKPKTGSKETGQPGPTNAKDGVQGSGNSGGGTVSTEAQPGEIVVTAQRQRQWRDFGAYTFQGSGASSYRGDVAPGFNVTMPINPLPQSNGIINDGVYRTIDGVPVDQFGKPIGSGGLFQLAKSPFGIPDLLDTYGLNKGPYLDLTSGDSAVSFALGHIGDGSYEYTDANPHARGTVRELIGGSFSLKCNALVYDALNWAGAAPSLMSDGRIPSAGEWGSRRADIGYYPVVTRYTVPKGGVTSYIVNQLREGDVISDGHHVGLVTLRFGSAQSVSAASPAANPPFGGAVRNDWGFRPGQQIVVRRFTN